ncbi:hypothetical protein BaRGS_00037857, partial [Batillaria attramentaria]
MRRAFPSQSGAAADVLTQGVGSTQHCRRSWRVKRNFCVWVCIAHCGSFRRVRK